MSTQSSGLVSSGSSKSAKISPAALKDILTIKLRTNLGAGVHCGGEVLQKAASRDGLVVDEDFVGVVGLDDESVKLGSLSNDGGRWGRKVLLLELLGDGILVTEDEVHLEN